MKNYDFHSLLEPMEFQNLVRDIVQIKEGIYFESFADGRDEGIDGLYCNDEETIILQAKRHGTAFPKLKYKLSTEELPKVEKLRPTRYILCISMDLSPGRKREIYELFKGYIKNTSDILTSKDLNNLLSMSGYEEVEKNYPKLWWNSVGVISKIVDESINRGRLKESESELKEAFKTARKYVQTNMYKKAFHVLDTENVVMISGEPGMGKTAMAYMLALTFLQKYSYTGFTWVNSIDDIYGRMRDDDEPQVFILDDFWGSIFYDKRKNIEEKRLEKLIESFRKNSDMENKKLILTTREYILQQALHQNEVLYSIVKNFKLQCVLEEYNDSEKTQILFQHLKASNLNLETARAVYSNSDRITNHYGYNPRVIDLYLSNNDGQKIDPYQYLSSLLYYLEYPEDFWKEIFENLSTEAKILASIVLISHRSVDLADVKTTYSKYFSTDFDIKSFEKIISELEKTIIITHLDYYAEESIVVSFQNPSFEDFLYSYISNNSARYVPFLLGIASFYDQILYILEHFSQSCSKELNNLIETKCISELYTLPMRIADYGDRDSLWPVHPDEKNTLGRVFHLIRLCDINKQKELYNFLEQYIYQYCQDMGNDSFYMNYYELVNFPGVLEKFVDKGLSFNGEEIIKGYYSRVFNINHYKYSKSFEKIFPVEYQKFRDKNYAHVKKNLEAIILDSLDYFLYEDMEIELDMLVHSIAEVLKEYGLNYTEKFRQEIFANTGIDYQPFDKKTEYDMELPEKVITKEEQDYEQIVNKNTDYFYEIDDYKLKDKEIIETINRSLLTKERKIQLLEIVERKNPWYIYEYLEAERPLQEFLSLLESNEDYPIYSNITLFYTSILYSLSNENMTLYKRFLNFCMELFFQNLENGQDSVSERNLKKSAIYKVYLKDDIQLQEMVFSVLLVKKDNWFVIQNNLLLVYCFATFISIGEEDLYETILQRGPNEIRLKETTFYLNGVNDKTITNRGIEYLEYELERLLYKTFEEIDPERFNKKYLYGLLKKFIDNFENINQEEKVLLLLKELKLVVSISSDGTIRGSEYHTINVLEIAEYFNIGRYFELNDGEELNEEQIILLIERSSRYDKINDEYIIEIYKEKDITVLRKLGLYDIVLYTINEIEKVYLKFSEGDYSVIEN